MYEDLQLEIEKKYNKNQLVPRLKSEFKAAPGFDDHIAKNEIPKDFAYTLLAQMHLHKRANLPTLVGLLRHFFIEEYGDTTEASQKCSDMLCKAAEADLVDWYAHKKVFVLKWTVNDKVQKELETYQYPLPMVIPPKQVNNNLDSGYLTIKSSIILRDNHHDDDVCLDHINRMNQIKLKIDFDTANMIQNKWRGLDKPKQGEDFEDYQKRVKAFNKYDRTARDVMTMLAVANDGYFYLTHRYDKRGRCYSQGYHVNYMGNDWNKAVVQFAHEEIVRG